MLQPVFQRCDSGLGGAEVLALPWESDEARPVLESCFPHNLVQERAACRSHQVPPSPAGEPRRQWVLLAKLLHGAAQPPPPRVENRFVDPPVAEGLHPV